MNVLCISSQVVYGPVGNSAAVPALEQAGLTALAVPTTILSNHPGHGSPAGFDQPAETMRGILKALHDQGWLNRCGAVMTGYFRDPSQVAVAAETISAMQQHNPNLVYLCDPIVGDDHTGLYVPLPVAQAIRDQLVPLANVISPNRFELEWLTGHTVANIETAAAAARTLPVRTCLATSLPASAGKIATAIFEADTAAMVTTELRSAAPHGTGDLLSGLFLAAILTGHDRIGALAKAMAILEHVLDISGDTGALALPAGLAATHALAPLPVELDHG